MKNLYCANCGMKLQLSRKALPKLGIIVDVVSYHECSEVPIPFSIEDAPGEFIPIEGKDKFVKSLNELSPRKRMPMTGTDNLRDRRFDQEKEVKSSAPSGVLSQIRQLSNSIPAHDIEPEEPESEG